MAGERSERTIGDFGIPLDLLETPKEYERELPHLSRTLAFVNQFRRATKPKVRDILLDQMAGTVVRNPSSIVDILNNFDLMRQITPDDALAEIQFGLIAHTQGYIGKRFDPKLWLPAKIEDLVRLGLDCDPLNQPVINSFQRSLFNSPKTVEEAIDLHYNASWAMVETDDLNIQSRLFSILCYETDIVSASSLSALLCAYGTFASTDKYLAKHHALLNPIDFVGIYLESLTDKQGELTDSKRAMDRVQRVINSSNRVHPSIEQKLSRERARLTRGKEKRVQLLAENLMVDKYVPPLLRGEITRDNIDEHLSSVEAEIVRRKDLPEWPDSVIDDPNEPLRKFAHDKIGSLLFKTQWENWVNLQRSDGLQLLTERPLQITDKLSLNVIAEQCESSEQKMAIVREVVETLRNGQPSNPSRSLAPTLNRLLEHILDEQWIDLGLRHPFDPEGSIYFGIWRTAPEDETGRLASILEYYRPVLSANQVQKINSQLSETRRGAQKDFTRSIGKRGYKLVISDPILRSMDYKSMTFVQAEDNTGLNVSIEIAGETYQFSLGNDYRIVAGKDDIRKFTSAQDQLWLELLTLSHLKSLVCAEEAKAGEVLVGSEKQLPFYRRQQVNKVEHLRHMPPGWKVSDDSYSKCLKSDLPIKRLDVINRLKAEKGNGGTLETGLWTYVSPAEKVDAATLEPVKLALSNATADLRKAIPLGEVSDEELDRIERDILGDLMG